MFILETNIDDMSPQYYDDLVDKLFKNNARDVFLTQILMKKNRPAVKLSVITDKKYKEDIKEIIFRNTTSIGIREKKIKRTKLKRKIKKINTKWGKVDIKLSFIGNELIQVQPEYDDLKRISHKYNLPIKDIAALVNRIAHKKY